MTTTADVVRMARNALDRARRAKLRSVPPAGADESAWAAYRAHVEIVERAERELLLARIAARVTS